MISLKIRLILVPNLTKIKFRFLNRHSILRTKLNCRIGRLRILLITAMVEMIHNLKTLEKIFNLKHHIIVLKEDLKVV